MTGKQKCEFLKQLRHWIIIKYLLDIPPQPECNFEGDCPGFCPACDAELQEITRQLEQKHRCVERGLFKDEFDSNLSKLDRGASKINNTIRDILLPCTMGIMQMSAFVMANDINELFERMSVAVKEANDLIESKYAQSDKQKESDSFGGGHA